MAVMCDPRQPGWCEVPRLPLEQKSMIKIYLENLLISIDKAVKYRKSFLFCH